MKTTLFTISQIYFGPIDNCGHMCNCPRGNIHMVQKKTTLSSSTIGNLIKPVPSLGDDTPSLNSLLPMLSELTSSRTETRITPITVSTLHQTTPDELTLPLVLIPRLQVTTSSPSASAITQPVHLVQGPVYMSQRAKHTPEEDTIEPVLLEMLNKAATDLDTKGVINLRKYTRYLTKKIPKPV